MTQIPCRAACTCVLAIVVPSFAMQRGAGSRAAAPEAGIVRIASFIVRDHALCAEAR